MKSTGIREEIDAYISSGDAAGAARTLREMWAHEKEPSGASFVVSRFEKVRAQLNLLRYRIAFLRSFTVEPIIPLLRAAAFSAGIDLEIHLSEFNAYAQELFDPASKLYQWKTDAAFLTVQTRDIAPELGRDFSWLDPAEIDAVVSRVSADIGSWIRAFRKNSQAQLIVHNFEQPVFLASGILDSQTAKSQQRAIERLNCHLRTQAGENKGIYILDYDALVARHGRLTWHDERRWSTVRLPIAGSNLVHVAEEWMRFIHPLTGKIVKCLAVDLDNTLWGGVIGEDGMSGIQLGMDYPGVQYRDLQRALVDLRRRGILLAVCSKNNAEEALDALKSHPGMILKREDFAAVRINWGDKSQNLREIAAELNIGIESLAFLDDNPIERQQVRQAVPEVHVIDLPSDASSFARSLRECPVFERLTLSTEDLHRGEMYAAQRERAQLEQQTVSREDFYRSLEQEVEIAPVNEATLARVAQLTNKTNQFNLTTRRYTEQQIQELIMQPGWNCFSMRVRDRFGDNGLTAVAITHLEDGICEIDTFLMSCRVIGRTLETAFLSFLADSSRASGARRIQGWFHPSRKNAPARDFYASHGFSAERRQGDSALWSLDITKKTLLCPDWISLQNGDGK